MGENPTRLPAYEVWLSARFALPPEEATARLFAEFSVRPMGAFIQPT